MQSWAFKDGRAVDRMGFGATSVGRLEENVAARDLKLSSEDLAELG
jgi:aryl-alcohol dehydrogenase-like predicted oxidoreductase